MRNRLFVSIMTLDRSVSEDKIALLGLGLCKLRRRASSEHQSTGTDEIGRIMGAAKGNYAAGQCLIRLGITVLGNERVYTVAKGGIEFSPKFSRPSTN